MNTLLIFGDQHFSENRLADCKDAVRETLSIVEREHPDGVVLLGDLLHTHGTAKMAPYNLAIQWIKDLSTKCHVFILIGNHERPNNETPPGNDHFFNALKVWKNVTVIDEPFMKKIGKFKCIFMPFVPMGTYHHYLHEYFGEEKGDLYFSHAGFRGAKYDNGQISTDSDVWPENYVLNISGHYHGYQKPFHNLLYPGSLMQTCHGEENQEKKILLLKLGDEIEIEEIVLKYQEQFRTVTIDIQEPPEEIFKNPKHRYVLANGTAGELIAYHSLNKKIFGDRVRYVPNSSEVVISTSEKIDALSELRAAVPEELQELLNSYLQNQELGQTVSQTQLSHPKRYLKLKIKNFMCLKTCSFKLFPGINKLVGENGAGKSTLLNAVEYCLFGGNSPSYGEKKLKTEVSLEAKDQWTIIRSSNPRALVLILGNDSFNDDSAQSIIDATFGRKDIWRTTSQLEQKARCTFFSASEREKRDLLSLIFNEEPSMINLGKTLTEDEAKLKKEKEQMIKSFEEFEETTQDLIEKPKEPVFDNLLEPEKPKILDFPPEPEFEEIESLPILILPPAPPETIEPDSITKCNKEIEKLNKEILQIEIAKENEKIKKENSEKITSLKRELPNDDEFKSANKIKKLKNEIGEGVINFIDDKEIETLEQLWKNWENVKSYQKEFGRMPFKERIDELKEGNPIVCPQCTSELLFDGKNAIHRPKNWKENKNSVKEKKLLQNIIFPYSEPMKTLEEAENQKRKFESQELLKKFPQELIENHENIIKKYKELTKEIDALEIFNQKLAKISKSREVTVIEKEKRQWEEKKAQNGEWEDYLKRKEKYDDEKEKIITEHNKFKNELERKITEKNQRIINWKKEKERILEEMKRQEESYFQQKKWVEKEKERLVSEWEKAKEKWKKLKEKRKDLRSRRDEVLESWRITKDLFKIFKTVQSLIFERRLEAWNLIFDGLLKRCFENVEGKILAQKETKTGTVEKITLEIELDGIKRKDIKNLSGGEADIFSIVFLFSSLRLLPGNVKLICLDESLSQISKHRIDHRVLEVFNDYLTFPGFFTIISSHDSDLFSESPEISL